MTSINTNSTNSANSGPIYYGGELPAVIKNGHKPEKISIFTDSNKNGYVDYEDFSDQQFANYLSDNGYFGTLWNTFKDIVENLYKSFKSANVENASIPEGVDQVESENTEKEEVPPSTEIVLSNNEAKKLSELKRKIIARQKELDKLPRDPKTDMYYPEVSEEYNNLGKEIPIYYEQLKQPEIENEKLIIKDENGNIVGGAKAIINSTQGQDKLVWLGY